MLRTVEFSEELSCRIASHTTPIMELFKKKPVAQTSRSPRTFLLANTQYFFQHGPNGITAEGLAKLTFFFQSLTRAVCIRFLS